LPGDFPDGWRHLTIGEIAQVKGGKRLPKGSQWSSSPTSHPYIRATDIKNGRISEENLVFVPEEIWPSISRYIVLKNDVVITIAGTIGSVALVPETLDQANLTENAAKICELKHVSPQYLSLFLAAPHTTSLIAELSTSTTQAKLALFRIESICVPIPPIDEQDKIVKTLEEQLSRLDASLAVANAIEKKASALRRSLLHAAFSGSLTKEWREGAHV
jgi:restriction endonuclease S subunit